MPIVPTIALDGLQVGLLGTADRLSLAAANSKGEYDLSCFTDAYRVGMYFNRTPNLEFLGMVVGGQQGPVMRRNGSQVDMDVPGTLSVQGVPITGGGISTTNKDTVPIYTGQAVTIDPSGSGVLLASAASTAKPVCGLAFVDASPLAAMTLRTGGLFTLSNWTNVISTNALTPKAVYYLDPNTPGYLTSVAPIIPGQIVQQIGTAITTTSLALNISEYLLL